MTIVPPANVPGDRGSVHGVISLFARHPTAPNLLMAALVLIGMFAISRLNRQFFPDFELPRISVTVPWTGASAEDVETNILDVLEPELRFLDNVYEVTSYAREGTATISLEFNSGADMQKAQADVEQAVSQVVTLPEDSERPIISRATLFDRVAKISISGPFSEQALKSYAKDIRDGLLDAGIDRVSFEGNRDEEIWIQVSEAELRRLDLSLNEIAQRVRENTQDLPGGKLEGEVEIQLRSKSERKTPESIADIEVKSSASGDKIFLKDIARIDTRYEREGKIGLVNGRQGIELNVQRSLSGDTIETMRITNRYLEAKRPTLPPTLNVELYDIRGELVAQRLGILVNNGIQGLVLVLLMLFIFLNARIAFWVAVGIPVALLAAIGVMYATGQSINMISMFALIMMLGIIVDDAIVVGEQAATNTESGLPALQAAEQGAQKMLPPVTAATLTTMASFLPIFFIGDRIGDIMLAIPLVVMAVLIASLIECFLILPGHLRHSDGSNRQPNRLRRGFDAAFNRFRDGTFRRIVATSYAWRYTTVAILVGCFILALGALIGGRVGFQFFPSPEPEYIRATVNFGAGTLRSQQKTSIAKLENALFETEKKLLKEHPNPEPAKPIWTWLSFGASESQTAKNLQPSKPRLVKTVFSILGKSGRTQGENIAEIGVQLTPSEERTLRAKKIMAAWRKAVPDIPGVERVAIAGRRVGPPGRDVDVRLQAAPLETLKQAAEDVKEALTSFPGVTAIADDLPYGKQEYVFELTPRGNALGFTGTSVGQQVRNAFEGAIATRFARGDEEITVRVMRQQSLAGPRDLTLLYLIAPDGERVPLTEVVNITERRSFSIVQRRDGVRTVGVEADIDAEVSSTEKVVARLEAEVMPKIAEKYGLRYAYKGRNEERQKSFANLKQGALLALCLIYIILAWVFGSYWKPFAVMLIIPFGFVGALAGHYLLGYNLTIISMIGLLGLSGILVNDSIVLVSRIKERLNFGETLEEASIRGSQDRLRAVLLTSLTTIGGLTPLLFETSRQAQFLIPMAVTIVFGLAAATVLVLILVPSLIGIGGDIGRATSSARDFLFPGKGSATPVAGE